MKYSAGSIELPVLARALGIPHVTLWRWVNSGLVGTSLKGQRGRGASIYLSMDDATEAAVIVHLRRAGASLRKIREAVRLLRSQAARGKDFLILRAQGTSLLMDGTGTWKDLATGQGYLIVMDLGESKRKVNDLVQKLKSQLEAPREKA